MTKQNKNRKGLATLEEMVQSGSQLILMQDDETEQPIEEIAQAIRLIEVRNYHEGDRDG
ncbi:MAG: hypothetical protein WC179_03205 [Candidatus Cloacimonadaceae bacterium]|jgi:hypothetical protein|nr:hypothetical protein [Candidatus Cloacimonadota bacterium]MCB5259171.1 hypothetical protein [Candidatus Cloacimonadota bacterium]